MLVKRIIMLIRKIMMKGHVLHMNESHMLVEKQTLADMFNDLQP